MKNIIVFSLMFLSAAQGYAQIFSWAKDYGSSNSEGARSLAQDADGNIFIFGSYDDSIDFGGAPNIGLVSNGSYDAFLLKTNATGEPIWAITIGGESWETANRMVRDAQSNFTLGGSFGKTVDFNPGPGVANLTNSDFDKDQYVVRLTEDGSFVWVNHVINGEIQDLTVDNAGNTFVLGKFQNVLSYSINGQVTSINTTGGTDVYLQKIDPTGKTVWVKTFGGASLQVGYSIKLDSEGNIYCTGVFTQSADFGTLSGGQLLTSQGEYDIFLTKMTGTGELLWAKGVGSAGYDLNPLVTVGDDDKVYLTGNLSQAAFVNLYNSAGDAIWEKQFESPPGFVYASILSIVPDTADRFLITGAFIGSFDFDPSDEELILSTNTSTDGDADCFLGYFDSNCSPIWVQHIGGTAGENGNAIGLTADEGILLLGGFTETLEIDVTGFNYFAQTNEENDIFLLKIQKSISGVSSDLMDGTFSISPNPCSSYFEVNSNDGSFENLDVVLLNLQGQALHQKVLGTSNPRFELPANIPSGNYLVQLSPSPSVKTIKKILVQK